MLSISYWGQNKGWKLLIWTDRSPPIIYAEILHTQTEGLRESNLSFSHTHMRKQTHTHTHTRRLLQRSRHWWLICLEGSLHFSSAHYAGANEGDIHSALSFVTEQKRQREREWQKERWKGDIDEGKRDGENVSVEEDKKRRCMLVCE